MKRSFLVRTCQPTDEEKKRGAEVVFMRSNRQGNAIRILACKCYESWEQWGANTEYLGDNVDDVEKWRNSK